MTKVVLSNAVVLEGEDLEPVETNIVVRDGKIERIDKAASLKGINLKRSIIMPPFVNSHTHILDSIAAERYLGRTLDEVVGPSGEKFRALELTSKEQLVKSAAATLRDMLATGTLAHCTFCEKGRAGLSMIKSKVPVQIVLGRPVRNGDLSDVIGHADGIGLSSPVHHTKSELRRIAEEVHRNGKILSMHIAEDGPCADLEFRDVLRLRPTFLVHGTHLTDAQLSELSKSEIPLVFCHRANHVLGAGEPKLKKAMEAGVRFFIGTDNAMVCQPDMFCEVSFAWAHMRLNDPSCGPDEATALLRSATLDPAAFFGLPWGSIEEGSKATFIILARKNNLRDVSDVRAGIVNRARADNLREVYFNGKAQLKLQDV
ncbi:MAG: amidohydrolase family protein [Candidatus Hadarchaeales archaeon]